MKIDLHVHTIKVPNKDKSDRNIKNISDFCEKMDASNVGIVAITNHNYFDFDQYNDIEKEIKKREQKLLVIPGVEIDISIGGNRRQINVLFSPKNINKDFKKFYSHFEERFKAINSLSEKYIELSEFKNFLLNEKDKNTEVILYIDRKKISNNISNNSTSFTEDEVFKYLKELSDQESICIVRDVNKEIDFNYFMYWRAESLVGSDNLNWDDYIDNSNKLCEYNTLIDTFEDLFLIFKKGSSYDVFSYFKLLKIIKNLEIKDKSKVYTLNNIKIVEGATNVIFGPKATGKTELLKALSEKMRSKNESIYYQSNDNLICLIDYKNNKYFDEVKNKFNDKFNELLNYKDYTSDIRTSDFYNFSSNKGTNKLFIFTKNYSSLISQEHRNLSKKIISSIDKLTKYIEEMNEIKKYINNSSKDFGYITINYSEKELEKIVKDNLEAWFNLRKRIFIDDVNKKMIKIFENILKIYKKTISKPNHIGLQKLFESRKHLKDILINLQEIIHRKDLTYTIKTFHIPEDEHSEKIVDLKYKLIFLYNEKPTSEYSKALNWLFSKYNRNKFVDPTERLEILNKVFKNNFLDKAEEDKNFVFFYNNQETKISNGERHFLNLFYSLDKDREYYFLDEPETSLNNIFISNVIQQKLIDLNKKRKTIVMTTHNNILGMNSRAMNFIFRDNKKSNNNDLFDTLIGSIQEGNLYDIVANSETKINIREKLFEIFEGDKDKYIYRRKVYGIN